MVVVFVLSAVKSLSEFAYRCYAICYLQPETDTATNRSVEALPCRCRQGIIIIVHVDMIAWSNVFWTTGMHNDNNKNKNFHMWRSLLFSETVESPSFPRQPLSREDLSKSNPFQQLLCDRWRIRISRVKLWNSKLYDWPLLEMANKSTSHKYYFNPPRTTKRSFSLPSIPENSL